MRVFFEVTIRLFIDCFGHCYGHCFYSPARLHTAVHEHSAVITVATMEYFKDLAEHIQKCLNYKWYKRRELYGHNSLILCIPCYFEGGMRGRLVCPW